MERKRGKVSEEMAVEAMALLAVGRHSSFCLTLHPTSHFYGTVY